MASSVGRGEGEAPRAADLPLGAICLRRPPRLGSVSSTHVVPGSSRAVAGRRGEGQPPPPRPRHSKYQMATCLGLGSGLVRVLG